MDRDTQRNTRSENATPIILFALLVVATWAILLVTSQPSISENLSPDVLIIYSSGQPYKTISEIKSMEADAVTTPTPIKWNCKRIAEELGSLLQALELDVRIVRASDIRNHDEILNARAVILGSPAHFWNVSWEMKKLLDEHFGQIYMNRKPLDKHTIAAFSMAEVNGSANDALKAFKNVIRDCRGRLDHTMTFLTKHSQREVKKRINKFASKIAHAIRNY